MARLVAPDRGLRGVDVTTESGTQSYDRNNSGVFEVNNPKFAQQMRSEGFFDAALNPYDKKDSERGFNCPLCGFSSWFIKCSRCDKAMLAKEAE